MTHHHDRREWFMPVIIFGLVLVMGAIFAQSYLGREALVSSQRARCLAFGREVLVPLLNNARADLEGNLEVAKDPGQSGRTRRARYREAMTERRGLLFMDGWLDPRAASGLSAPGRRVLRRLARERRAFSCTEANPDANLVVVFHRL